MTLSCEDANSKFVDVVTVADFDDEERVGDILVEILTLKISRLRFGQYFEGFKIRCCLRPLLGRYFVVED